MKQGITYMAKRKIELMYTLFGWDEQHQCKTCDNLLKEVGNRTYYKCLCYGNTSSIATDWKISNTACGLYNKPYNGKPVIEYAKHQSTKKPYMEIEGQMRLEL